MQLKAMPRAEIAGASWRDNGCIILVPNIAACAPIVDAIAAEHVELALEPEAAEALSQQIAHAGAIFIGRHTPEAIGDYVAGTNHVLPTSRAARFSGGLGVADFLKRTSIVACTPESLAALGPAALALAEAEGLDAHGRSVSIRLNRRADDAGVSLPRRGASSTSRSTSSRWRGARPRSSTSARSPCSISSRRTTSSSSTASPAPTSCMSASSNSAWCSACTPPTTASCATSSCR